MITVSHNLNLWANTWEKYLSVWSRSFPAAVAKQAKEFSVAAYIEAKKVSPKKGEIKSRLLQMLSAGRGLKISKSKYIDVGNNEKWGVEQAVETRLFNKESRYHKRTKSKYDAIRSKIEEQIRRRGWNVSAAAHKMTIQALMVEFEIARRESHRMFAAMAARFTGDMMGTATSTTKDKRSLLGTFTNKKGADGSVGTFAWGTSYGKNSAQAAAIYSTAKGQEVISKALTSTRNNMIEYIARKEREAAQKAARRAAATVANA